MEGGYQHANPLLFQTADPSSDSSSDSSWPKERIAGGSKRDAIAGRSDSLLPEYYEEGDGGRSRRNERGARRSRSLERRNTVADVETVVTAAADAQGASEPSASIIHEVQFVPGMASSSK